MRPADWVGLAEDSLFGLQTLPLGVFTDGDATAARVGVRVGERVLDLGAAAAARSAAFAGLVAGPTLDPLLAAGRPVWDDVHRVVTGW